MNKKVSYSVKGNYIDVATSMKLTNEHNKAIDKMRESCLSQLKEDRKCTGFLEYRDWQHYDAAVEDVVLSESGKEVEACFELCVLGLFEQDYDAWHTTFHVADGIDWVEM